VTNGGPPGSLDPDGFAGDLYESLTPLARPDPDYGWALLILCNAVGTMFQLVDDWVRDQPEGPGWSLLLDVDRCPPEALGWLAQIVGVRLLPDSTDDEKRERIRSTDGFRRGTRAAMEAAIKATLTGAQSVLIKERDGDPYVITVSTFGPETPNAQRTRDAMLSQKPAGLVANFSGALGPQTYDELKARIFSGSAATYATTNTTYRDYVHCLANDQT
jgi:hypothetical protein